MIRSGLRRPPYLADIVGQRGGKSFLGVKLAALFGVETGESGTEHYKEDEHAVAEGIEEDPGGEEITDPLRQMHPQAHQIFHAET